MSTYRIIRRSFHLSPYRIQVRQLCYHECKRHILKRNAAGDGCWLNQSENHFFSDEVYFYLFSFVKNQNSLIWGMEHPHVAIPPSLNSLKVMVLAVISSEGLTRSFSVAKHFLHCLISTFCVDLWRYRMPWRFQRTPCGTCKTIPVSHCTPDIFHFHKQHSDDRVITLDYWKHGGSSIDWHPYSFDILCHFSVGEGRGTIKTRCTAKIRKKTAGMKQCISTARQSIYLSCNFNMGF